MAECIESLGRDLLYDGLKQRILESSDPKRILGQGILHLPRRVIQVQTYAVYFNQFPSTFRRSSDLILINYKWNTFLVYSDDIIISSNSIEDHIRQCDDILK